tara:strand:- start:579 stop:1184 length:606 start_codon:yes stop_codon:yes gene_type:complete
MSEAKSNKRLTFKLLAATLAMFGFGFALVPLYDVMCDALGINGKTNTESALQPQGMIPDTSRLIRVEFMAHLNQGIPWQFGPKQAFMEVHPGEVIQTAFIAKNLSANEIVGQAVPSVSPGLGATYFNKIECFCFNQQPLASQDSAEMPLIFYIEPDIPESIHTLTLSYTLYDITQPTDTQLDVAKLVLPKSSPQQLQGANQ